MTTPSILKKFTRTAVVVSTIFFVDGSSILNAEAATPGAEPVTAARRVLRVGPGHPLSTPSAAAAVARDNDIVEIENGDYYQDVAVWPQRRLTLRGVGGRPRLIAQGASADDKAIWVIRGDDVEVEHFEFLGAKVPDRNGAGIRFEGKRLAIRHSIFRDNENGLLATGSADGRILVEHCEFAENGSGDGYSHNIYIGRAKTFTLRFSSVHGAVYGHNVKSRARTTFILYNRISDGSAGRTAYSIDLAEAGDAVILGNIIQKAGSSRNPTFLAYGLETPPSARDMLHIVNNTAINDSPFIGRFVVGSRYRAVPTMVNNLFSGRFSPRPERVGLNNALLTGITPEAFARAGYRPAKQSSADSSGTNPGTFGRMSLNPSWEYVPEASKRPRIRRNPLDIGAFAVND